MVDFILDLDRLDIEFIHLVLDTLEAFRNYKLCIFVCNRYKLASKVGRYLVSIATNYSPLVQTPFNRKFVSKYGLRKIQQNKGRVGSIALNNVMENINPDYLRWKHSDEVLSS
jgi:hypothetical protein